MPRITDNHQKVGGAKKNVFLEPLKGAWLYLHSKYLTSRAMQEKISIVLNHPVCGSCYSSPVFKNNNN